MKKKPSRRMARLGAAALACAAALLAVWNALGWWVVHTGGCSAPRDATSGVMLGAVPVVLRMGNQKACLLLHGWLTTPADFGDLPRAIAESGWDVHAPLHFGHGTRPADLRGVTAEDILQRARLHYEQLRGSYERVALIGFSMGGTVATILAAEDVPDRLVLIAPFYGVRYRLRYVLPAHWWHALLSPLVRNVYRARFGVSVGRSEGRERLRFYTAFPISASRALFGLRRRAVESASAGDLSCPVLLVRSDGDTVCSARETEAVMAKLCADRAGTVVFARSDHHILNDYERAEAATAIAEFLRDPVTQPGAPQLRVSDGP
jgi:carboxylesterase